MDNPGRMNTTNEGHSGRTPKHSPQRHLSRSTSGGDSLGRDSFVTKHDITVIPQVADILKIDADCIVTSEDVRMKHTSTITDALCRIEGGGEEFKRHRSKLCEDIKKIRNLQNIEFGDVVSTSMNRCRCFPFKYVLHAFLSPYRKDQSEEWKTRLLNLYINILEEADRLQLRSLALPFLGTGFRGSDHEDAIEVAVQAVADCRRQYLEIVHFVSLEKTPIFCAKNYCESYLKRRYVPDKTATVTRDSKNNPSNPDDDCDSESSSSMSSQLETENMTNEERMGAVGPDHSSDNTKHSCMTRSDEGTNKRSETRESEEAASGDQQSGSIRAKNGEDLRKQGEDDSAPASESKPSEIEVIKTENQLLDTVLCHTGGELDDAAKESENDEGETSCDQGQEIDSFQGSDYPNRNSNNQAAHKKLEQNQESSPESASGAADEKKFGGHEKGGLCGSDTQAKVAAGDQESEIDPVTNVGAGQQDDRASPTQSETPSDDVNKTENKLTDMATDILGGKSDTDPHQEPCDKSPVKDHQSQGSDIQKQNSNNLDSESHDESQETVDELQESVHQSPASPTQSKAPSVDGNQTENEFGDLARPATNILGGKSDSDPHQESCDQSPVTDDQSQGSVDESQESVDESQGSVDESQGSVDESQGSVHQGPDSVTRSEDLSDLVNGTADEKMCKENGHKEGTVQEVLSKGLSSSTSSDKSEDLGLASNNPGILSVTSKENGDGIPKPEPDNDAKIGAKKEDETCPICMDVITDEKKLPKCGHVFCRECIDNSFKHCKPICPSCQTVYGVIKGSMPRGTMNVRTAKFPSLPGYDKAGLITIDYHFPNGTQTSEHHHPGRQYRGTNRTAYLPNNKEGQTVLALLRLAWERRLTFTIGRSVTTGRDDVVVWNDIHHKTNMNGGSSGFGYPDETYLSRVKEELATKGVTEDQLKHRFHNHDNQF